MATYSYNDMARQENKEKEGGEVLQRTRGAERQEAANTKPPTKDEEKISSPTIRPNQTKPHYALQEARKNEHTNQVASELTSLAETPNVSITVFLIAAYDATVCVFVLLSIVTARLRVAATARLHLKYVRSERVGESEAAETTRRGR